MAPSRLLKTLDQDFIGGVQKQDRERIFVLSPFPDDRLKIRQFLTAAHVYPEGDILFFALSVHDQLRKFFDQKDRQVVGTVKSHVFQCF